MSKNEWCQILKIERPNLGTVKNHREANVFACLIVALLERGEAMTLVEVAERFVQADIADFDKALRSLQRCQPGRPPVYRDGDHYALDPHDRDLELWVFTLGLRGPRMPALRIVRPEPSPLRVEGEALTIEEITEAWTDGNLRNWSAQRLTLAILEAHADGPMTPEDVMGFVSKLTPWHSLHDSSGEFFKRKNSLVDVDDDGKWRIAAGTEKALIAIRKEVRARIESDRRYRSNRFDPAQFAAQQKVAERKREAAADELASMARALLVGFPTTNPQVVALLDVGQHTIQTFVAVEFDELRRCAANYDILGAENIRPLLQALGIAAQGKRLAELSPPQKTITINDRGKKLKITTELLVRSSCGIRRPFTDPKKLNEYFAAGDMKKLCRRLEADIKSLFAMYEYGRLHGGLLLDCGAFETDIPVPWVYGDEPKLYQLMDMAFFALHPLNVVVGNAPVWNDPWASAQNATVVRDLATKKNWLFDENRKHIQEADVQRARLIGDS